MLAALALVPGSHAQTLTAPNPGPTIGGATTATHCGDPSANIGTNSVTGDATRVVADLTVPGAVGGLSLVRYGHSRFINTQTRFFGLGNNWRHN